MSYKSYIPVYAATLLLSAALLFSVQPMFSRMILPLLGGTPQVWNTAMLFFQVALLAGYAYAHGTTRLLGIRAQAILHLIMLVLFVFVLPLGIPEGWLPPVDKDPTLWQLSLMALTVGGPFFALSASAPMLQRWFSHTDHPDAHNPYFLYGASNLGSMTSLLAYPFVVEPLLDLSGQSLTWASGYIVLIVMVALSVALVWRHGAGDMHEKTVEAPEAVTWPQRILWLVLAFIPSSLMLGVTTFITTDIASVPLLWILPLALYVGTFILVFARREIFKRDHIIIAQGILLIGLLGLLITGRDIHPAMLIGLHMTLFFVSALTCHTELARTRPHAGHLTEFYLVMSIGGALGGFFNAIIAPNFFVVPIEYPLALGAAAFMRYAADGHHSLSAAIATLKQQGIKILNAPESWAFFVAIFFAVCATMILQKPVIYLCIGIIALCLLFLLRSRWLFALSVCLVLALFPPGFSWGRFLFKDMLLQDRNFFGVVRVADTYFGERILLHGTTNHGTQPLDEQHKLTQLSYYSPYSPLHDAFAFLDAKPGPQNVAVLGLGIGVTACFQKQGRHFDFFEIDPEIAAVAQNTELFTYLSDCGTPYDIILGDGRLTLSAKQDQHYDLILSDVFSSDNIPAHLLTVEAITLYLQKLKPGGTLIFNISNNYLDIEPILAQAGKALNVPAFGKYTRGGKIAGTQLRGYPAHFFIFLPDEKSVPYFTSRDWTPARFRKGVKLWTDQFSNIVSVFGNKTGWARHKESENPDAEKSE